jgi:Dolichyl-phosphate-mannose-protein mannosyltransferase
VGALLLGSLPRIDAVSRMFPPDRDQRTDVRRYYMSMATSALEGKGWTPSYPTNFIPPPGQAFFLYALKRIWPSADYQHLRSAQAVISIATILLAFALGTVLHDTWSGVICSLLVALNYRLSYLLGCLLAETNHIFVLLAFMLVMTWALRAGRLIGVVVAGLLLGLACLFKPTPLLLGPALALYIVCLRTRGSIAMALGFLCGFCLALAPWTARNYTHYGRVYPISTNGGTLLALSNAPDLDSNRPEMIYWDDLYKLQYYRDPAIEAEFAERVDVDGKPDENLKDRAYLRATVGYIVRHPIHFARNYLYKLRNFLLYPARLDTSFVEGGPFPFPFREIPGMTVAVVFCGLVGVVVLAVGGRGNPAATAVALVTMYLLVFGALFHLTRDGRMNLPFQVVATIPASVALVTAGRWSLSRFDRGRSIKPTSKGLGSAGEASRGEK